MTQRKNSAKQTSVQALMEQDRDLLRRLMKEALQQVLEAEMEETLQAGAVEHYITQIRVWIACRASGARCHLDPNPDLPVWANSFSRLRRLG
jgi:hypothetical protein